MTADGETVGEIRKAAGAIPVYLVGDCQKPGKMGDAVRQGYMTALSII
jgi:hypothetical protein